MKKIEKIKELHESSIALIEATDLENIGKQENEGYAATIILTANERKAQVMGVGNIVAQAALIASLLKKKKRLMLITLDMLTIDN